MADVVVDDTGAAAEVLAAIEAHPLAATALVLLLRGADRRDVSEGLVAESETYSMLQAGPEHRRWLDEHPRAPRADGPARVDVQRDGGRVVVTLDRPAARNAVDAAMQAALVDAFAAAADPAVTEVELRGNGPVFSSGGDLGEFGSLVDPASAHLLRLGRSPGAALHRIADRTTAYVQGACHGAGVELPAFAGRVVADPGTTFTLPEVAMGLIPGAGGTVSITARIGRHRTAWLAITGSAIDAETALAWHLVDELAPVP
jgi:enoyl-CoA hydratase/carnithine racemase